MTDSQNLELNSINSSIHDINESMIINKCNELFSELKKELMFSVFGDNCK